MPLTFNGSGTVAGVAAGASGFGKVLQVVQATTTTEVSTTSTSVVTTGLTASITPSSASSKILIYASLPAGATNANFWIGIFSLHRGTVAGTSLGNFTSVFSASSQIQLPVSIHYLDSPATTSSTQYTVGMRVANSAATVFAQSNAYSSVITLMEISG